MLKASIALLPPSTDLQECGNKNNKTAELTSVMHSQCILCPAVENSDVMCHDAWLMEGRLRNRKNETKTRS